MKIVDGKNCGNNFSRQSFLAAIRLSWFWYHICFFLGNSVMQNDNNLLFIREKIYKLRTAVMYASSNSVVKLTNDIVTALDVDEEGQLWYVTNAPLQKVEQCEQNFQARLFFYKKGVDFFVEVSGDATIVDKNYISDQSPDNKKILVKMNMINIEYTEPHTKKPKSKIEILAGNCYTWFINTISFPHHSDTILKKLGRIN